MLFSPSTHLARCQSTDAQILDDHQSRDRTVRWSNLLNAGAERNVPARRQSDV